ncbi:Sec34-like family protein [Colletotrichum tamarilloi]|uniref:Conserved oligomeric Golgi complex subunit 3 n=1 Tax=Colletotrichum tamarilloi TaxID=1209934 RepID=A0ABQ9R910_9PEZI|nr:Sec34-like family protein [Colletotrichum tamarilloi]KAK1498300.1 Sec34-like family protein [Colletotrichum tamarilloi]
MYDDSWYSFVPEVAKKASTAAQGPGHRRKESLLQQSNALDEIFEEIEDRNTPPEAEVLRRAKSYSDFYHVVRAQLAKDEQHKRRRRKKEKTWDALDIATDVAESKTGPRPVHRQYEGELLEASQQEYLLYKDQLTLTERHLDMLIDDTNQALKLLTTLSESFQSVEAQTSSFQSQCEDLLSEQHRLEKLADEVGTDLHFYAYLDNVSRRLNAPGAGRLVDDESFGEILRNLDSCIGFMSKHTTYRDAESYLARYEALLTKALHLLEVGFTNRLESISSEIASQIVGTKSEATRHALAYGRFEEMILDSYSLIPNIHKVINSVYDEYGLPITGVAKDIYSNTTSNLFSSYLAVRDRDLKPIVQHDQGEFKKEIKDLSVETASRNYIKQSFERAFNEANLFAKIFGLDLQWSSDPESAYGVLKSNQRSLVNPANLVQLAANLNAALQTADLDTICSVVGWLTNEYLVLDYDEEESPFARQCRELSARLLTEHLWVFTDNTFEAEITKTIAKATVKDESLTIGPVVGGVSSSNAFPPVKQALKLLAKYDQAMPKERSQKNSQVIFKIVRETIQILQRAEARIKSIKAGTDADLFMVKNLLIIKNELVSLEIGDIRGDTAAMQHFGHIWDNLSPQNWMGFVSNIIGGSLWSRGATAGAATVTAKTLTVEDMSEQLDELLRQSIVAFTQRWGGLTNDARARKPGVKPIGKVEKELDEVLLRAFSNQPEVIAKLKEAIEINAQAQEKAQEEKKGIRSGTLSVKAISKHRCWGAARGQRQPGRSQQLPRSACRLMNRLQSADDGRELHKFLAILVFAGCRIEAARNFTEKLAAVPEWPPPEDCEISRRVCLLPADRQSLTEFFDGDEATADKFYGSQALFCTVVLRQREETTIQDGDTQRLPYVEEELLGSGSFGRVYKVKIAKGHFEDRRRNDNRERWVARKDYIVRSSSDSDVESREEGEIMKMILSLSKTCENIMENLGTLNIEYPTGASPAPYSLFMPLAVCDLGAYMKKDGSNAPKTAINRAGFIRSAIGLANGLKFLHEEMQTPGLDRIVCYHMDLKPSNVLIFRESGNGDGTGPRYIWKLSDFGMSRVKIRHHTSREEEKDIAKWFTKRRDMQQRAMSGTQNRRGQGTYLPPESFREGKVMNTRSDVWSLGCILSVLFVYLEGGKSAIDNYETNRLKNRRGIDASYDVFFHVKSFGRTSVHSAVKNVHKQLIHKAAARSVKEHHAVRSMLSFLGSKVLKINQNKRCSAKEVENMLRRTLDAYEEIDRLESSSESLRPPKSSMEQIVQRWRIPRDNSDVFKGCKVSPDGSMIAYWSDSKISLFAPSSAENADGEFLKCYIFDLGQGATADSSPQNHWHIRLPTVPEVYIMAMSTDQQNLVFVVENQEDESLSGSIFHVRIEDLIEMGSISEGYEIEQCGRNLLGRFIALDWPAEDVMSLSLTSQGRCYAAIRPYLRNDDIHHIPVVSYSLTTRDIEEVSIEPRSQESNGSSLFTTFAGLHQQATCIIVSRETRLFTVDLLANSSNSPTRRSRYPNNIEGYRILRVMVNQNNDAIFALGIKRDGGRIRLLEIVIPEMGRPVSVRELAQLPSLSEDDEFTGNIVGDDGSRHILVTALVGPSRHAVFEINLPGSHATSAGPGSST